MTIHKADSRERSRLLWVLLALLVLAVVGAYALWRFREQAMLLFAVSQEEGMAQTRTLIRGLTLLLAAQALALAWYLGRRASSVVRLQQFPLPGSRTVLNQQVRYGAEAVRLGRLGQIAAAMFALIGLVALWISLR